MYLFFFSVGTCLHIAKWKSLLFIFAPRVQLLLWLWFLNAVGTGDQAPHHRPERESHGGRRSSSGGWKALPNVPRFLMVLVQLTIYTPNPEHGHHGPSLLQSQFKHDHHDHTWMQLSQFQIYISKIFQASYSSCFGTHLKVKNDRAFMFHSAFPWVASQTKVHPSSYTLNSLNPNKKVDHIRSTSLTVSNRQMPYFDSISQFPGCEEPSKKRIAMKIRWNHSITWAL